MHVKFPVLLLGRYTSAIFSKLRQKLKTLISPNLIHEAWSFISSRAYAKQVAVKEIFGFFHQEKRQEVFAGTHFLISTNLELLPAVFFHQADSVRLSIWVMRFFFSIIFYVTKKPRSFNSKPSKQVPKFQQVHTPPTSTTKDIISFFAYRSSVILRLPGSRVHLPCQQVPADKPTTQTTT